MPNLESFRRKCKKLMIDLGIDKPGIVQGLAKKLKVNPNSLTMALTGYRNGKRSEEILRSLYKHLKST